MSYNRFALERVGGLEIIYNRPKSQVVDIFGSVKGGRGYAYNQDNDYSYIVAGGDGHDNRVASTVDVRIVKEISVLCTIGLKIPLVSVILI
jgi:hypothetical protein